MKRRDAIRNTGLATGAALLGPTLLSVLQSCQPIERLDWQPLFFTDDEARCMSKLVDIILPRTDTPGALDVQVDIFMDTLFAKTLTPEDQATLRSDIKEFNEQCRQEFGDTFIQVSDQEQKQYVMQLEQRSPKFNGTVWGTPVGKQEPVGFYRSTKSLAIWAYTSSEEIGKNVLNYDPIPQEYLGCIPLADIGNAWSL